VTHPAPLRLLPFIVLLGLTACGYPSGPGSINLVDGSYQGSATLVTAGPTCPAGQFGIIEIGDCVLDYGYVPGLIFEAAVKPDGTLHDEEGKSVLDGKLDGDHLAFTITTPDCKSAYDASYIWNHS